MTIPDHFETMHSSSDKATHSTAYEFAIRTMIVVTFLVIVLGLFREWFVMHYGELTIFQDMRHIALDAEQCLNAWYSSSLMLTAAILLWSTARLAQWHQDVDVIYWRVLSIVFVGLSLDESTSVHELALEPVRDAVGATGVFYYAWVIPALVLVPLFGLAYHRFLGRLAAPYGLWILISGAIFVSGALGMEMAGGWADVTYGEHSQPVIALFIIEESLELIGMTSFVIALMSYLRHTYPHDLIGLR